MSIRTPEQVRAAIDVIRNEWREDGNSKERNGVHHTTTGYALRANAFAQPVLRRIAEL